MTREKQLEEALKFLLSFVATPYCGKLHHKKSERHEWNEPCPVEERLKKMIKDAEKLVSKSVDN